MTDPQNEPLTDTDLLRAGWRESTRRVNGVDLHVVEAGAADAPLLVLLHGFPEFWWSWRRQIGAFAAAGWRVLAPDMRGYNASEAPPALSAYVLDTLAADVVALAAACGAHRFRLVGHDWGAAVAWWVAAQHPHRVERVVTMNGPHPDVLARQALKHPTQALRSLYIVLFQLPWLPEALLSAFGFAALKAVLRTSAAPGGFEPGELDRHVQAWSKPGRLSAMLNYYRAVRLRRLGAAPGRVTPPMLILWGADDRFLERQVAEAGLAICDRGRLVFVEGAGHWVQLEQPERVNREVLAFMREGGESGNAA